MKYYIEAFRDDGGEIFGNLDGQGVLRAKQPRKTKLYKSLLSGENRPCFQQVHHWKLITEHGEEVGIIPNKWYNKL